MRPFDFAPLYRSTVGFDRLVQLLDNVAGFEDEAQAYPPYNIERLAENQYRITMAVAGFAEPDIKLEVKEQTLTVTGQKAPEAKEREFLHHGIAGRAFERRFQLADHVEVTGAGLKDRTARHRPEAQCAGASEATHDRHRYRQRRSEAGLGCLI